MLYKIARNKAVLRIYGDWLFAHTDDTAVAAVQRGLVNYAILLDLPAIRHRTLFDFQWMNYIVFLHKDVDLLCVGIPEIGDVDL